MGLDATLVGIYKIDYDREYNLFPVGFGNKFKERIINGKGASKEDTLKYLNNVLKYWKIQLKEEDNDNIEKEIINRNIDWVNKTIIELSKMPDGMIFISVNDHEGLMKQNIDPGNFDKEL